MVKTGKKGIKVKYAIVPTGAETCQYCLMLASRGFVYGSKEDARRSIRHFHVNCDCHIVTSTDDDPWLEGYDPDECYLRWAEAEGIPRQEALAYRIEDKKARLANLSDMLDEERELLDDLRKTIADRKAKGISTEYWENRVKLAEKRIKNLEQSITQESANLDKFTKLAEFYSRDPYPIDVFDGLSELVLSHKELAVINEIRQRILDGNEHSAFIGVNETRFKTSGLRHGVEFDDDDIKWLTSQPPDSVTAIHNHPMNGPPSNDDLKGFVFDSVSTIITNGNDGNTYKMVMPKGYHPTLSEYFGYQKEIDDALHGDYLGQLRDGIITIEEYGIIYSREFTLRMSRLLEAEYQGGVYIGS